MVCASAFISFIVAIIGSLRAHRAGRKVGVWGFFGCCCFLVFLLFSLLVIFQVGGSTLCRRVQMTVSWELELGVLFPSKCLNSESQIILYLDFNIRFSQRWRQQNFFMSHILNPAPDRGLFLSLHSPVCSSLVVLLDLLVIAGWGSF